MSDRWPSQPLALSDAQLTEIFRLTKPLQPACRDEFLQRLAQALQGRTDLGDGEVYRLARQVIRDHHLFDAPIEDKDARGRWSKYA